jgi:hypothetical protein
MRFLAAQLRSQTGIGMDDTRDWQSKAFENPLEPLPVQGTLPRPSR